MQRSIGIETDFRVLDVRVEDGPRSAGELRDRLERESETESAR
ncbi:hypothetical protein [Natrinema halophilum]|nr:hypothetical protein [Natrinema halophilum]